MPSGVFKPYAGVSTAILLFTKTNSGGTDDVWFYDMKADGLSLDDVRPLARAYDLCVMHTSTPSFAADVKVAEALKAENPGLSIGMVGAAVAVVSGSLKICSHCEKTRFEVITTLRRS